MGFSEYEFWNRIKREMSVNERMSYVMCKSWQCNTNVLSAHDSVADRSDD
jgi:hypothetical protein